MLVTVRYAEPKPFWLYATRARRRRAPCPAPTASEIMLGLVEALIERMAEALDKNATAELERCSREIFYKSLERQDDQEPRIHHRTAGIKGDLLGIIRESLVSLNCSWPITVRRFWRWRGAKDAAAGKAKT